MRSKRGKGRKAGRMVRACGDMIILDVVMVAVVSLLARGTVAGGVAYCWPGLAWSVFILLNENHYQYKRY
jgi:hypothetical protein